MTAARKFRHARLARRVLISLAAVAGIGGLAVPAGASSSIHAAGTLANVVSLADSGGGSSLCALLSSGTVDCWGYNQFGQLGNGTTTNSDVPVPVLGVSGAKAIAGDDGSGFCAVLSTGHLKCWGHNTFGELGAGTTAAMSTVPVAVKNISTATAVFGSSS